jgi:hypothetical protein
MLAIAALMGIRLLRWTAVDGLAPILVEAIFDTIKDQQTTHDHPAQEQTR